MRVIEGFELTELLYRSQRSALYRGRRLRDGQPVVLKCLEPGSTAADRATLQYAHALLHGFTLEGIPRVLDPALFEGRPVLVMHDIGGRSADRIVRATPMPPADVVRIAIALARTLGRLHQYDVIHQDIRPSNVVVNEATGEVQLIDFQLASRLASDVPVEGELQMFRGSLAFIAPERTGKTGHLVDQRSDLYSLGATLFYLLTRRPPFEETDPVAMAHAHLASAPRAPREINRAVPEPLSRIVLKLLAKPPEDRYQSAYGVEADLRRCLSGNSVTEASFELAQHDVSSRFRIPDKLYGRQDQIESLVHGVEETTGRRTSLVLVSGPAGVGKSELVARVRTHVASTTGIFLSAKFDQLQNVPFTALEQCLHAFVQDVLAQSDDEVDRWKSALTGALRSLGGVLVERVPSLADLIGPQPDVPDVAPPEAFNRFVLAVVSLLQVICQRSGRLVIFLDDLHWAGSNSIRLLEAILTSAEIRGLTVIGAFRDGDVDHSHPLRLLPERLAKDDVPVSTIAVKPLARAAVEALVQDTLAAGAAEVQPLAALVFAKTGGDPFFVKHFLRAVHAAGGILFDADSGRWRWDLDQIATMAPADNVAHLITDKLRELPEATREILNLAACLGGRFTLGALARAAGMPVPDAARSLWPALRDDVLIPLGGRWRIAEFLVNVDAADEAIAYRFSHDWVRIAAYELFPAERRHRQHAHIGRMLVAEADTDGALLFESVNQFNAGREAIDDPHELLQLATLNLKAAMRARSAAAFSDGFSYVSAGIGVLPADAWTAHAELTLKLHVAGAELAYLVADFAAMDAFIAAASRVTEPAVRGALTRIRVLAALSRGEPIKAVDEALGGLAALGIHIPRKPGKLYVLREFARTALALRGRRDEELLELPPASDPVALAAMSIFGEAWGASYIAQPELFPAFIVKMVQLAVSSGTTPVSSLAFANYGLLLIAAFGNTQAAKRFGTLAMRLAEHPACRPYRAKTQFVVYDFLQHWSEPLRNVIEPTFRLHHEAREAGDFDTAAVAPVVAINAMSNSGVPLAEVAKRAARYVDAVRHQETLFLMFELARQRVFNLIGQAADDPLILKGQSAFDETTTLSKLESGQAGTTRCGYHLIKSNLAYLLQRYDLASRHADLAIPLMSNLAGSYQEVLFHYYDALACLQTTPSGGVERRRRLWRIRKRRRALRGAARRAPMNFEHLAEIVDAELARVTGRQLEATNGYDRAIARARTQGFLEDEAVATELAGRFHLRHGRGETGRAYLRDAYAKFDRWGAAAKLEVMRSQFPWISSPADAPSATVSDATQLDARTLLKASEAISRETVLRDLLKTLMTTTLESAGADRAVLFLHEDKGLELVARIAGVGATPEIGTPQPLGEARGFARSVVRYVERTGKAMLIDDAAAGPKFGDDPHFAAGGVRSVLCLPIVHQNRTAGILYLENSLTPLAFSAQRVGTIKALSGQMAISVDNARLYERLRQSLHEQLQLTQAQRRFISAEFLQALGRDNIIKVGLGDHVEKELSILFSDMRGFTALTEDMTPGESIDFINTYLGRMEPSIVEQGGFIDSYIGDAIMALFDTDADRAVLAALEMLRALRQLNDERRERGQSPVAAGIGIHTGPVMLGTIGGRNHLRCSVIGDVVNLASRVEGLTKQYELPLLITESTRERLSNRLRSLTRIAGRVRVAGRHAQVGLFEVVGDGQPWAADAMANLMLFEEAADRYFRARTTPDMLTSLTLFERYASLVPGDPLSALYIVRCRRQIEAGVREWDGVEPLFYK